VTALLTEHPHLGVECVLREPHIASSTYYRWRRAEREPCARKLQGAVLTERIRQVHTESGASTARPAYMPSSIATAWRSSASGWSD
jgi:hypothetical protein